MSFSRQGPTGGWVDNTTVITATQQNGIDVNQSRAVDGTAGGDYTPTGKIRIGGANGLEIYGTGAAANVQLSSRSVTRWLPANCSTDDTAKWQATTNGKWVNGALGGTLFWHADLPHGQTIATITVRYIGAGGHAGLPGTMPTISLIRVDSSGTGTVCGSIATDSSGTTGDFQLAHDISATSIAHTIDRTLYRYHVAIVGESGANQLLGAIAISCSATCTVTGYTEF